MATWSMPTAVEKQTPVDAAVHDTTIYAIVRSVAARGKTRVHHDEGASGAVTS